jgi:simple sugar transport system permease protein
LANNVFAHYLISYLEIRPFIVTLAGMFFARGATTMVEVKPRSVQNETFKLLRDIEIIIPGLGYEARNGNYIDMRIEPGVVVALLVVGIVFCILQWTRFGRNLYAVGGNIQNALMLGINVRRTKFCSHLLCGLLAGIGGFVYLLRTESGSVTQATGAKMKDIAASIIGGLLTGDVGNIAGTLFGVLGPRHHQQHRGHPETQRPVMAGHHHRRYAVLLHRSAKRDTVLPEQAARF